jgi:hypothetical protein
MGAIVSLDGFMADDNDGVGPLGWNGKPATGGLAEPLRLEDPTTIVRGDRVTHLVYDVSR